MPRHVAPRPSMRTGAPSLPGAPRLWACWALDVMRPEGRTPCPTAHLATAVRRLVQCGVRTIGEMGGEVPTWMVPSPSNPCRAYKATLRGLVASR